MSGAAKGHKWRHNMAHTRCMLDKQDYTHAQAHAPGYLHKQVRAHTHTQIYNTYCFSTAKIIIESASLLRYTYIGSLVILYSWQWHVAQQHTDYTVCFPLQQWLRQRAIMLRFTYIAFLILSIWPSGT
jgi:hypothetical protein